MLSAQIEAYNAALGPHQRVSMNNAAKESMIEWQKKICLCVVSIFSIFFFGFFSVRPLRGGMREWSCGTKSKCLRKSTCWSKTCSRNVQIADR
jgi:hypothetical protein